MKNMELTGIERRRTDVMDMPGNSASSACPYVSDIGIIAFVPEAWGGAWMSRHQVLTRLSKYFNVVWFNPVTSGWRELWFGQREDQHLSGNEIRQSFMVYDQSKLYPIVYKQEFLGRFTATQRLRQAQRMLRERGCKKVVMYLWRPDFADYLDLLPHQFSCYHIVDEYTFSPEEKPTDNIEARLISRVDQVFIHSQALMEKKGKLNPNTLMVPNGVDYLSFSTPVAEPDDLRSIPHPRVGYIGYIKRQLDFDLLIELSRRHSDWSFVLVGPKRKLWEFADSAEELFNLPNVHYLGGKPASELPAYTQNLDVCIMCYKVNDYTKFIYPLKLHEYLAAGRPVVGSPIRSLLDFTDVIETASTTDEWSQALENSLSPAAITEARIEGRQAVARKHDWDGFVHTIARTICERIGPDYGAFFETSAENKTG